MFEWKDSYSVNHSEIDKQHKRLFEIGQSIYDILTLNDNTDHYDEIVELINELKNYTEFHFKFEEDLMEKYNFDGFDSQKIEHVFFIKKLVKLGQSDIDEDQKQFMLKMLNFVSDWIAAHILNSDMKYKGILK